jgi:glutamine amidotransferase
MGWNLIDPEREAPVLAGLGGDSRFYFVHSYYMACQNPQDVLARTSYGGNFPSIVQRGRVIGAQFHPEKSHRFGMRFFQNFVAL